MLNQLGFENEMGLRTKFLSRMWHITINYDMVTLWHEVTTIMGGHSGDG